MSVPVIDGDWVLISDNPITGKRTWMYEDEQKIILKEEHYVSPLLLERNKQLYNESLGKRWGDGQVAASIPQGLWFASLSEAKLAGDEKYVKRWLNDSDHRAFRTFHGTL